MKFTSVFRTLAVIALSVVAVKSATAVVWNGSVNFDFTLGANWDGGVAPPEGGAPSNLNVTINAGTPLAGLVTPGFFRIGDLDVRGAFHINGPAPGALVIFATAVLLLVRQRTANTLPV